MKFPPDTRFSLYVGLPLSSSGGECVAWDRPGGRSFPKELFDSNGSPCTEEEFNRAMAEWDNKKTIKGVLVALPASFPRGTEFGDYEGLPLTDFAGQSTAWDRPGGRWFSNNEFFSKATPCTENAFRALVGQVNEE